ncbi:elongator complex protein 3 [Parafannyhessea sp. LCP19S3_B1]|uniref:elongator complex protein 3 n=1 Tax=Parafannyhessea sp. LCP19S3_B1 TaxID=3438795 RepID=UPI003F96F337
MEELLTDILDELRRLPDKPGEGALGPLELDRIVRRHNRGISNNSKHLSKRYILLFYLRVKQEDPARWKGWAVDPGLERRLLRTLRMKPRRTASGVATITVLTRPQPCSSNCVYCPNDLRMPKSYLSNEPACQRAEQNFFDPYLQVMTRLTALYQMGHSVDKVELIVLGGTWSDYPRSYQLWFIRELFRALNDWPVPEDVLALRQSHYRNLGISNDPQEIARFVAPEQRLVNAGLESYNQGFARLYGEVPTDEDPWGEKSERFRQAQSIMQATEEELAAEQARNETAAHRVVGLVIETRPDTITPESLTLFRRLGCTKIQIGIQSTRQEILDANHRATTIAQVKRAFSLIRLFGFKIHAHLMVNLLGSTPREDKADFKTFVCDPGFLPDEVKLYPCALVAGTRLVPRYHSGEWRPYTEEELLDVLVADTLATPPYMRISRMIRDIGADDILVGNKKTNLRQMVEGRIRELGAAGRVRDIRFREIARSEVDLGTLAIDDVCYQTTVTCEHFLQWVTPDGRIAGFLRLSLPKWDALQSGVTDVRASELPTHPGDAMIREVHVYGQAAHLGKADSSSQHQGLGRGLVRRACEIAREEGYTRIHVISSVGTREYYRKLGFVDAGLYQSMKL